ncbi:glycosyltransferase [Candidatus Dojkabacteria bacterium]|nr:glycosyltransferase [Candidatus Dojkabacteria bacterium]
MNKNNIFIILPAYNEATRIGKVIKKIKKEGFKNIIVVDDGSTDQTSLIAKKLDAYVISHMINLGPGAATQTGFTAALNKNAAIVVTIDADGQHNPKDIHKLVQPILDQEADIVFGSRIKKKGNQIPFIRKTFNFIANIITLLLSSLWLTDSQTGFKALNKKALSNIHLTTNGFEFCTELITQLRNREFEFQEVPIDVTYTQDSLNKGQNFASGINIVFKLFIKALIR